MDTLEATPQKQKLLDQVREALYMRHYSCRTEASFIGWIKWTKYPFPYVTRINLNIVYEHRPARP